MVKNESAGLIRGLIVGLLFTSFFISQTCQQQDLHLQLVQLLFRHGDRNPIDMYPNDPYNNESFWPEGFGQLTRKGKQQHLALGQFFRTRYSGYLNASYSPYEIYVQASDVDRTLMSAEVDLAGLYPPNDNVSLWDKDIMWQPIPVHTVPSKLDNKLRMQAPCPRLTKLIDEFHHGPEMAQIYSENKELFEFLSNRSGKPVKTLQDVDYLYDDLFIESLHNYTLPEWTKGVFPGGQFRNLTSLSFQVLTRTDEMKRLKAGPLIKDIVHHFQQRAGTLDNDEDKLDPRLKLFMYSAHDTTLASLLNSLGLFNGIPPPYASAIILELLKNITSQEHFVKIWYRNDSSHEPYLLTLPGCNSSMCPLSSVVSLTQHLIPDDWEKECNSQLFGTQGIALAALIIGGMLSLLFVISVIVVYLKKRGNKAPAYPYLHLQTEDEEA